MSVDSAYIIKRYLADDDVNYVFDTESFGEEAIQVYRVDTLGVRNLLVLNTDYTLEFDRSEAPTYRRGKVILTTPLSSGEQLSLERKTPIINTLTAQSNTRFPAEQFENMLDRICFIQQEIEGGACDCRSVCTPVYIITQPVDYVGTGTAVFTVAAGGTDPLAYQWYEDGILMTGETSDTLSVTVSGNEGKSYYVTVTNECGATQSNIAIIDVDVPSVPELLYASTSTYQGFGHDHMVVSRDDPINSDVHIAFAHKGYHEVVQSTDDGQTWEARYVYFNNVGYPITGMRWMSNELMVTVNRDQLRSQYPFRSFWADGQSPATVLVFSQVPVDLDDGNFMYSYGFDYQERPSSVDPQENGNRYFMSDNEQLLNYSPGAWKNFYWEADTGWLDKEIYPFENQPTTNLSTWATQLIDNSTIISTAGGQGTTPIHIRILSTDFPTGPTTDVLLENATVDGKSLETDGAGTGYLFRSNVTGVVTLDKVESTTTVVPLATQQVNFGTPVENPVIGFGDAKFLVAARDKTDATKLYIRDVNNVDYGVFTLPAPMASRAAFYYQQLLYHRNNDWLLAYIDNSSGNNQSRLVKLTVT